jgi:glycosyltransferase involved in cell wall biosynthesis
VKLSIIVPAYNEQATIIQVLEAVHQVHVQGVTFEIIVVDDGSTDATPQLLAARPDLYGKSIRLPRNGGKGAAVQAGLLAATGDYVLFQDADLEYRPEEYPKLVQPVVTYGADVVLGSRTLAPSIRRVHYFWNMVGNNLVTFSFNLLFNRTFTDVYTCYLLFRRELVDPSRLRTFGFDQQAEILAKCVKRGRIFYEVPIEYHGRSHAEGKKIRATDVPLVLLAMLRERLS